jgi:hypothetical protein
VHRTDSEDVSLAGSLRPPPTPGPLRVQARAPGPGRTGSLNYESHTDRDYHDDLDADRQCQTLQITPGPRQFKLGEFQGEEAPNKIARNPGHS